MEMQVTIKNILRFLDKEEYEFSFFGSENEMVQGLSTLFNYKNNTMTCVSSMSDFSDYVNQYEHNKIQWIIADPSEDIFDCFANVIQINNPKSIFFSRLNEFFDENSKRDSITE